MAMQLFKNLRMPNVSLYYTKFRLWWHYRDRRLLLQAFPAVLGVGLVAAAWIMLMFQTRAELETHYRRQGLAHLNAGRAIPALMCFERLAYMTPDRPDVQYNLARAADAAGQPDRAVRIMADLAPQDHQGHAMAHLWFAKQLLQAPNPSKEVIKAAESHLLRALDGELEDRAEAEGMLGELYLRGGRLDDAEVHLTKAVKVKPSLRIRLAQTFALKGDKERAKWEAEQAISFYRAWTKADLNEHRARLGWAEAVLFLEDFPTAIGILDEGLRFSGEHLYRQALAKTYMTWSATLARDPKVDPGEQLKLMERALAVDPANMDLIMQLWAFTKLKGEAGDKARVVLRAQLANGKGSGLVHLALGMDAWDEGKQDAALIHLEQAYKLAPQLGIVANNLAWVLANSNPPDLERALALINTVLREYPNDAMCRDTRGQILLRMGKYKEALTEFQAVLPVMRNDPKLHEGLAETYEKLGLADMAAEHRKQAQRLKPSGGGGAFPSGAP